jgi:hypothetical protein
MKKIVIVFLLLSINLFSQEKESILDKASKETCEYIKSIDLEKLTKHERNMKLGLFMIKMYSKYKKEFNGEGIFFDLSKGEEEGRKFGTKFGVHMAKFCPETLILLAKDEVEKEKVKKVLSLTGNILRIKGKEFATVYMKDTENTTQKFVWLRNFMGSNKLIYAKSIKGLKVKIIYQNIEWYAPKIKEYITKKEITGIEFLKE